MRFLCELLYDNYSVQTLFCELTGIVPMKGKVFWLKKNCFYNKTADMPQQNS